ncbi:MAG: hydroxymethylbilane synthase [Gemmatimonadetes bacterium]|nr:hydroxymethylbilane synthase [Gemmatimonadota bacterium]
MTQPLRIGTRSSALALFQARLVASRLDALGVPSELVTYTTIGDRILDQPLSAIGEKGLFTAELEADLHTGRIDCAVHSLKDLPTADPPGLLLAALLEREDPRDALVVREGVGATSLATLPEGARIGTSSLRRRAQLRALRPDLSVHDLRGNVGTRLRKLDDGDVDAALLASAGLKRLDLAHRIVACLDAPTWLAAPGQGVIAVQARAADAAMLTTLQRLDHAPTRLAATAERALLATLEGGCQVPIGAATTYNDMGAVLHGLVASLDGRTVVRGACAIDMHDPASSGQALAAQLHGNGGEAILHALRESGAVRMPEAR